MRRVLIFSFSHSESQQDARSNQNSSDKAFLFFLSQIASNELLFYNSLKMKMSIIIAYLHMMLGLTMHAFNAYHFNRPYDFWFEFIPRAIFLTCIIGYMVLLIIWKWLTPWESIQPFPPNMPGNGASAAPYILTIVIGMFMNPFHSDPAQCKHMLGCPQQAYIQGEEKREAPYAF